MSKYVYANGYSGYSGFSGNQAVIWHYKTDIDRNLLNKWFVNIFEQGVLEYTPTPVSGGQAIVIPKGTSFIIKEKTVVTAGEESIAKVDMVEDNFILTSTYIIDGTYHLIAEWVNDADSTRGVEFLLLTDAQFIAPYAALNYVKFGEVILSGGNGTISDNNTDNQTLASLFTGLNGWSGWSGQRGISGWSGYSSYSGASGKSGWSGPSGWSGYSSDSGWSGYSSDSGWSGVSGYSGSGGYDISIGIAGKPAESEVVLLFITPRAFSIPDVIATGSYAKAGTAGAGSKFFTVWHDAVNIGTITFAPTPNVTGIFNITGDKTFNPGEILKITAPAVVDADLADIAISILATI